MGPVSDLLFETFSIISVSSTEAKIMVIKADENLIKAEACGKMIASKAQEKLTKALEAKIVDDQQTHYRDIGLNFSKYKIKRVLLSDEVGGELKPTYICLSVDTSMVLAIQAADAFKIGGLFQDQPDLKLLRKNLPEIVHISTTLDQDILLVEKSSRDLVLLSPSFKELERVKGTKRTIEPENLKIPATAKLKRNSQIPVYSLELDKIEVSHCTSYSYQSIYTLYETGDGDLRIVDNNHDLREKFLVPDFFLNYNLVCAVGDNAGSKCFAVAT